MSPRRIVLLVVAIVVLLPALLVAAALLLVRTEWAERRVERMVSAKLDREVQVEGISVRMGWPPGLVFARLRIGNPEWARTKNLVDAEGLYARVAIPPLLRGMVVVPSLGAHKAQAGLEMDGERATWRFGPRSDEPSKLVLGRVYLDDGHIVFLDLPQETELEVDVKGSLGEGGELRATASGKFRGQAAKAEARVPGLDPQHESPIRVIGSASFGKTNAAAEGVFSTDARMLDLQVKLSGDSLRKLNEVTGIVLPDSPPYRVAGRLRHEGSDWIFDPFEGKVGDSDLAGALTYSKVQEKPMLKAVVRAKLLDFDDLGPLIGAPPKTAPGETADPKQKAESARRAAQGRLLPDRPFGVQAWGKMDADVTLDAARIQRPKQLPLEKFRAHLVLEDSVLRLEPLEFGLAGGRITSHVVLDANRKPLRGEIKADVQGLKLGRLFPTSETMKEALGTLYGRTELVGHGYSVADLLGTSDGKASLAVDGGRISALLVELLGLDVAESIMLFGRKHQQVQLRCAVSGFEVKQGVATADSFVIDTDDTMVKVEGNVNLAKETLDIEASPYPKDRSPIALRSPIVITGLLREPKPRPKAGPLAARAAAAVALGAINPALSVLALLETGPGKDTDCGKLLAEAKAKGAQKKQP